MTNGQVYTVFNVLIRFSGGSEAALAGRLFFDCRVSGGIVPLSLAGCEEHCPCSMRCLDLVITKVKFVLSYQTKSSASNN
jgi:hypothetical protein